MNERQAIAQSSLSRGENPGQDSSKRRFRRTSEINDMKNGGEDIDENDFDGDENDDDSEGGDSEGGTTTSGGEKKISKSTFGWMLAIALILDGIGLIPIIGWSISSVILILIYLKLGVKFHIKNVLKFGACDLIKLIPGLSLIPAFVLSVILNVGPMVEGIEESIPGGEMVQHAVQKAISTTKR